MTDLFGEPIKEGQEIAVRKTVASGYAANPGSGPENETCGSCKHCVGFKYKKCQLMSGTWTHGLKTDIKSRSKACWKWESK